MQSVKLIGLNGKFTPEFAEHIIEEKNAEHIDHNCYTGTSYENLCEYAGRICYRSGLTGKQNRSSQAYHYHIKENLHHSIYGHSNLTFLVDNVRRYHDVLIALAGLPGWYPNDYNYGKDILAITFNARLMHNILYKYKIRLKHEPVLQTVAHHFQDKFPFLFEKAEYKVLPGIQLAEDRVERSPVHRWYSFEITTSRRVAQELTRHAFQSGVSAESTRFVDVSENDLIFHPDFFGAVIDYDEIKKLYRKVFEATYKKLKAEECYSEGYCKKQARGAAAEVMPLSLASTMVYSCSETELKEICSQRITEGADKQMMLLAEAMKKESGVAI